MVGALKRRLMRWFRIPPDPEPPAGSAASVRVFRAAPNYYRYALTRWGLRQVGVVIGILVFLSFMGLVPDRFTLDEDTADEVVREVPAPLVKVFRFLGLIEEAPPSEDAAERVTLTYGPILLWLELLGIGFFLLQLPLSYAMVRLDYELRWYIVTDRSLRIREGVWSIREATMTFANIQNVAIEQGPIQRLIGIADLKVRTAGGGSGSEQGSSGQHGNQQKDSMHIAYFRGVDNAPQLRDTILAQLKTLKDAGLGDSGDEERGAPVGTEIAAARRVLEEARALRAALNG